MEILGVKDVAKICDVTPATVRNWDRAGKLKAQRTSSGMRIFNKSDIEKFARERETRKRR